MKVLILGLDGGNWRMVKMGIESGLLPNLKKLIDEGQAGIMVSTIPSRTCPAIPSLITGKNPGELGIHSFLGWDDEVVASVGDHEKFWDGLARQGIRSCIVGVPFTYPARLANGIMVSGMPQPPKSEKSFYNCPDVIKSAYPDPFAEGSLEKLAGSGERIFLAREMELASRAYRACEMLVERNECDLYLFYDNWSDKVQHFLWHRPELVLEYYRMADRYLGELLSLGDFNNVVAFSDHGFASNGWGFHTNTWLKREGYLVTGSGLIDGAMRWLSSHTRLASVAKAMATGIVGKRKVKEIASKTVVAAGESLAVSEVYFGIKAANGKRDELIERLSKLWLEADKGMRFPIFKAVFRREDEYYGRYAGMFPSVVLLGQDFIGPKVRMDKNMLVRAKGLRTGHHDSSPEGIYIAWGKNIDGAGFFGGMRIWDFAAAVIKLFGVRNEKGN